MSLPSSPWHPGRQRLQACSQNKHFTWQRCPRLLLPPPDRLIRPADRKAKLEWERGEGGMGVMLAAHQNIPAAPTHTCTHTNESSRYSYSNEKILSFKLWLFPSVAFNACRRDWKVGEQRKGEREGARGSEREGCWKENLGESRASSHPLPDNLSSTNLTNRQTDRLTDRQISFAGPVSHAQDGCQNSS